MSWRTFTGSGGAEYTLLVENRMATTDEGFPDTYALFVAHLHRGIGQLAGMLDVRSGIEGLLELSIGTER
jgi:hypothetical protein